MATRTIITVSDDLDGSTGAETVRFGLDGVEYEIDLNETNAAKLREELKPYVTVARRGKKLLHAAAGRAQVRKSSPAPGSTNELRDWGRANGFSVSPRGRIPGNIVEAYNKANAGV